MPRPLMVVAVFCAVAPSMHTLMFTAKKEIMDFLMLFSAGSEVKGFKKQANSSSSSISV